MPRSTTRIKNKILRYLSSRSRKKRKTAKPKKEVRILPEVKPRIKKKEFEIKQDTLWRF